MVNIYFIKNKNDINLYLHLYIYIYKMPPKKQNVETEIIEYMNVPLKPNHRYATEDEAIKANHILLWGKHQVSKEKLEENKQYLIPPKRITRAKEFRPDFLLAGVDRERREIKEKVEKPKNKSKMKKYELNFIASHNYTADDLPTLNRLYKEIGKLQDDAEETDEKLYNKLLDDEATLSDLIDKLEEAHEPEEVELVHENPNKARIEKLQNEIISINRQLKDITPSPQSKTIISQMSAKKNELFDEISELSKISVAYKSPKKKNKKMSGSGSLFEKTHGLSTTLQPYFYWYFDKLPTHVAKTKWRNATAEEAINNNMVSLYGVHKIPEKVEKLGKLIGHSGNLEGLTEHQLNLMRAKFGGKRSKLKKQFLDISMRLDINHDKEYEKELFKQIDDLNEKDEEVYKIIVDIASKIANLKGKENSKIIERTPFKYEEPKFDEPKFTMGEKTEWHEKLEKSSPKPSAPGEYTPRQPKDTPKSNNDIQVIETDFKPTKMQHIFKNDDETIYLDTKYFKNNVLMDKYAKKLASRDIYLCHEYYSEKMINKIFFHDTGAFRGTGINGGKINATKFFNKIGSTLKDAGHKIESVMSNAIDTVKPSIQSTGEYINKVIHGSNEYLPPIRDIINKYGNNTITGVTVGRAPVPGAITGALNAVSGGTFKEGMNTQPYDKLFHLFIYLTLNNGVKLLFEKNATINSAVNPPLPPDTETLLITPPNNTTTLNSFLKNAENKMGQSYFVYDPHYNNCQDYIIGLLTANGWGTPENYKWIKQDTGQLFANNKYLGTVAKGVTNFGGVVDRVIKGVGFAINHKPWISHHGHIQSILFKRPKYTETTAKKWLSERHFKTDVDVEPEHLRYRQEEPDKMKYIYRTKKINKNIEFIIGYPIKPEDLKYANL